MHPRYGERGLQASADELDWRESVFQRWFDEKDQAAASAQLADFIAAVASRRYSSMKNDDWVMKRPAEWWAEHGKAWPMLAPVAVRLMSLATSAAACERV